MLEEESIRALALSTAAGLSTMLGAVLLFFTKGDSVKLVTGSIGFAAGVMVSVSFLDLFPNALTLMEGSLGHKGAVLAAVVALLLGILLAAGLDKLVPHDMDAEHEKHHQNLYRVGFVSMMAIALHNFPEGIATFMAGYGDTKLGVSIALAIAMHNIPEGISVSMPIYFATKKRRLAFKYTFLSGVAEPIGALLAFVVLRPFLTDILLGGMFALVAGIMVYIAIEELIPTSRQYGYDRIALLSTFTGICIMPLTGIL